MADQLDAALFPFEDVLPDLEYVPLAARRALDLAGVRLTLEGWRSLTIPDRKSLAIAGAPDDVDVDQVLGLVRKSLPPATRIAPAMDPDPHEPPEALVRALGPSRPLESKRWVELRALERFALMHGYRRSIAKGTPSQLEATFEAIVPSPKSPQRPAGYSPPGAYSTVSSPTPSPRGGMPIGAIRPRAQPSPTRQSPAQGVPSPTPVAGADTTRVISTHLTSEGEVHMVTVSDKPRTVRRAVAKGSVSMRPETAELIATGAAPKGEVLATARIAGIMAAKRTPELIPLCHHVALTSVAIDLVVDVAAGRVDVTATAEAVDRTGVEMEAMVAVSVASLTLYDMLKGTDREIEVRSVRLTEKTGGKTGHWVRGSERPG